MAVTDMTDSLPYWARQGGLGATGGPGAAPMGGDPSQPPPGVDPVQWLHYLMAMGGVPQPDANPHGDGPPGPVSPDPRLGSSVTANPPASPIMAAQTQPPPAASPGPPVGAGMLDQSGIQRGPMGVLRTQLGASAPVGAGLPDQSGVARVGGVLQPGANPNAPAPNAQPVAGPLASGGAGGQGATSNPRFALIDAPNADPTSRQRGTPQMTALNLAGLFGRGQPAANPNAPAPNAQPVSAQRTVPGPLANAPMPPVMPGDIRNKRVANAVAQPNWWQNL